MKIGLCFVFGPIFAFCAPGVNAGLDPLKPITHFHQDVWGSAEGLPEDTVPAILQTPDGYLWFGTELGLVRFDGLRFTVFDKNNTPALKSNVVDALAVDRLGDLWIGSRGGGLVRRRNGEFSAIPTRAGGSSDSVLSLLAGRDGDLWIGTEGDGVVRLRNGALTRFSTKNGLPNDEVFALSQDVWGAIWVGTRDGLSRFADEVFTTYKNGDGLPNSYIRSLYASPRGTLWIGTNGGGLAAFSGGKFQTYNTKNGLTSNAITTLREDKRGSLWIGTVGGGLCRLTNGKVDCYTSKEGLPANDIWALFEDRLGDLWIGSGGGGLVRLSNGKLFQAYGTRQGLSNPVTLPVFEDHSGDIWIGTNGGGLNRLHNGAFRAFTTKDGLPDNLVLTICEDRQSNLWIGTRKGLTRFKNGVFTTYTKDNGLPSNIVDVAYPDAAGNLWIGTRVGLGKLRDGVFTTYTTNDGMSSNVVQAIYEDHEGNLWVGTAGGGLDRFKDGKFDVFDGRKGLASRDVFSVYEDPERTLWVGTDGGGLNRLKNGRFTSVSTKAGLPDDAVFEILEDDSNNLWMSSNKGVFRVARKQLNDFADRKIAYVTAVSYGVSDGMNTQECDGGFQPAGWRARDGRLWFPTTKGVVTVDPRKAGLSDVAPLVVLEQAIIDGHNVQLGREVHVPPGRGNLEFRYTAPNFQSPEKTIFKYRLAGFDRGWVDAGARRVAYYTNIPPGSYRFEVIASNEGKTWSPASVAATIALQAHFYQTLWFYGICILGVLGLVGAAHLRHVRQANEREKVLERRVEQRTAQLRNEIAERERAELELVKARDGAEQASRAKSEFLANMSHEIRTPMNGIAGMIDLALATDLTVDQYEYLAIVKSSADSLLRVINDILDLSKVEAGKLELDPADIDLRETLEDTVRLMAFRAEQKRLRLICELDPEIPEIVHADATRVRQIVLNLLGNAIKFTETGEVLLQATVEKIAGDHVSLHFIVRDTGIGIAAEQQQSIFEPFSQAENSATRKSSGTGLGLTISRRLIELMGGKIWVNSEVGQGSEFHFTADFAAAGPQSVAAQVPELENVRALVLDGDPTTSRLLTNTLMRWGARTTISTSGKEALAAVQEARRSGDPFLLLMADFRALSAGGLTFFDGPAGNGLLQGATIVMCNSADEVGQAARYLKSGVTAYLTKPIRQRELRDAVRRARTASSRTRSISRAQVKTTDVTSASVSRRILVAEDNLINQTLMIRLLQSRGHEVFLAANGLEALVVLDREPVDIVLMDVQMPEMDGFQVTSAIRERERETGEHLPIVAITACALKGDRERCLQAGMDSYISKPIRPDELFDTVENLMLARSAVAG